MTDSLTKFMDKLDKFTPVVKKNLQEIQTLDEKVTVLTREIKQKTIIYVKNMKTYTKDRRRKSYLEIQSMYKEAEKMSMRKRQIAEKMYDSIDNYVSEMDTECELFRENQNRKFKQESDKLTGDSRKRKNTESSSTETPAAGDKKKKKSAAADCKQARLAQSAALLESFNPAPIVPHVDMPVNPNEPTYCLCHQVSFGEMVMCDNKGCKTEWFHFQCVGLSNPPVGKWYCPACTELRKKKK